MPVVPNGNRAEDQDQWAKLALWRQRYWPILYLVFLLALALGFDFKTPKMWYSSMETRLKEVEGRMSTVEEANNLVESKIDVLLRLRCLDNSLTEREKQIAGLRCNPNVEAGQ